MGRRSDAQNPKSQEPSYTSDLSLPARTVLLDRLSDAFSTRLRHPRTASRTPDARTACDRQAQPAGDGGTPAPPTHHWASARPLRAGLAAAALAALLALAAPAAAQTTTVPFLTNLDSSPASANTVVGGGARFQEAIRFVVGSETGPFLIDEVEFDVFSANAGAQPVVRLHNNSQTGTSSSPGAVVATFESPPAPGTGLQTFRPPPGTEISLGPECHRAQMRLGRRPGALRARRIHG